MRWVYGTQLFFKLAIICALAVFLTLYPGTVALEWLGYKVDMPIAILFTIFFAFTALCILFHHIWIKIWGSYFTVPPQIPPFSDLDAISRALTSKQQGFNPYIDNPYDLTNRTYVYPSIWLYFFDLFSLNTKINFQIFNAILIYFYALIYLKLAYDINKKVFSIILSS